MDDICVFDVSYQRIVAHSLHLPEALFSVYCPRTSNIALLHTNLLLLGFCFFNGRGVCKVILNCMTKDIDNVVVSSVIYYQ